jgi:hypothetical protein
VSVQRLPADRLELAQGGMAVLGRFQEMFGYSFAGFVITAIGQLPANRLQGHFQIRGDSLVKVRHEI